MRRIARFMKVSREQFLSDFKDSFPEYGEEQIVKIYEELKLRDMIFSHRLRWN